MKDFITKEILEAVTVVLPETYTVGVDIGCDYMSGLTRAHVTVFKHVDGKSILVYSGTHTEESHES